MIFFNILLSKSLQEESELLITAYSSGLGVCLFLALLLLYIALDIFFRRRRFLSTALSSSGIIVSKIPGKYTYVEVDEDGYEYEEVTPSKLIAFIEFDIFDGRRFKIESINYRTTEPNGKVEVKYNPKDPLDYMVDGYYLEPQSKTKLTLATSTIFFILSLFFSYQLLAEYLFNLRYLS